MESWEFAELDYCEGSGLYWTPDQINPDPPHLWERMDEDGPEPSGEEVVTGMLTYAVTIDELAREADGDEVAVYDLIDRVLARPPGLLVGFGRDSSVARFGWNAMVFDAERASKSWEMSDSLVHSFPTTDLGKLEDGLHTYFDGYSASLRRALAAEIALAGRRDVPDLFRQMTEVDPTWAAGLVLNGVEAFGRTHRFAEHLRPKDVEPLLSSASRELRERVIQALPSMGRAR